MEFLIAGGIAGVAAVIGFLLGRRTGRTAGASIGGAPARSSPSGGAAEDELEGVDE